MVDIKRRPKDLPLVSTASAGDVGIIDGASTRSMLLADFVRAGGAFDPNNSTYLSTQTGAVARTLAGRLNDFVSVKDFGTVGAGADDSAVFQLAANTGKRVIVPPGTYKIGTPIALASGSWFDGAGRSVSKLVAATAGQHLFQGVGITFAAITNLGLAGFGASSTVPTTNVDGLGASITGLVTFSRCFDTIVQDCEISNFYYGVSANKSERHWVERNLIHNWYVIGSMASRCRQWWMERNVFRDCDQNGAVVSYAGMATGSDDTYLNYCLSGSFSFNHVENVPSWDGFMSHGGQNFTIVGNRMKNVRTGIDMSHYDTASGLVIAGNVIEATAVDVYPGAIHGGIRFSTDVGGNQAQTNDVIIANNVCKNFYNVVGMVGSSPNAVILLQDVREAIVSGNMVIGTTGAIGCGGIILTGSGNSGAVVTGNRLKGTFALGAIRALDLVCPDVVITGNIITQTTTSDIGVYISGVSNITRLAYGNNANNSTSPVLVDGSATATFVGSGYTLKASASYAGGTFANNTSSGTGTLSVTGAALGDRVTSAFSVDLQGVALLTWVSAANTVSYKFINNTGGSITIASGNLSVAVLKAA